MLVSESDKGAFKPISRNASFDVLATQGTFAWLSEIASLITYLGIPISMKQINVLFELIDVEHWAKFEGIPGIHYHNYDKMHGYFYFHHSKGDRITVLSPEDIDYTAALHAVVFFILGNMDGSQVFERRSVPPPTATKLQMMHWH